MRLVDVQVTQPSQAALEEVDALAEVVDILGVGAHLAVAKLEVVEARFVSSGCHSAKQAITRALVT